MPQSLSCCTSSISVAFDTFKALTLDTSHLFPACLSSNNSPCVVIAGTFDMPVQEWIPRIRLYFLSEDPALYAKRVAIAHQSRIDAVNAMRYHLCIDSMPADDMHSLSVEQINRILTLALNSKFLRVTSGHHQHLQTSKAVCSFACS